jgi:hypothetical protein
MPYELRPRDGITPDDYPIARRDPADRFGAPTSIENARLTWSYAVKAAEKGNVITLIAPADELAGSSCKGTSQSSGSGRAPIAGANRPTVSVRGRGQALRPLGCLSGRAAAAARFFGQTNCRPP